jgi:hypothetical protein
MFSHGEAAAQLSKEDQKCVDAINKGAGKVAKAQGGDIVGCIKSGGQGKLGTQTIEACLTSDPKGKVAKAISKLQTEKCPSPPAFPPLVSTTDKQAIGDVMIAKELDLVHSLFGSDLNVSVVLWAGNKDGGKCQAAVAKAAQKCQDTKLKEFRSCKKNALKNGAANAADLQDACLGTGANGMPDPKGKIAKKCGGDFDIAKKCTGQTLDDMIPGCAGAPDHAACIDQKIECEVCLALNTLDGLARDCDLFDNGLADLSCSVTVGGSCGDGVVNDPNEECDSLDDETCPQLCRLDCTCGTGPCTFSDLQQIDPIVQCIEEAQLDPAQSVLCLESLSEECRSCVVFEVTPLLQDILDGLLTLEEALDIVMTACTSEDPPPACDQTYPTCNGPCPLGEECVNTGMACVCQVPPPACDQTYPTCDGSCPPGEGCIDTGTTCECQAIPCQQTYPMCNGSCPPGELCVDGGGSCVCNATQPLDHFWLYPASNLDAPLVDLQDQFQQQTVDLAEAEWFGTPASKNGESIYDPVVHVTAYTIPDGIFGAEVDISNQFGVDTLVVGRPIFLLVPTQKMLFGPEDPVPLARDHYKCYQVIAGGVYPGEVSVSDQFNSGMLAELSAAQAFCTPVDKNGEGILNPDEHLACYGTYEENSPPQGEIEVRNQFHENWVFIDTESTSRLLCVPTIKEAWMPVAVCGDGLVNQPSEECDPPEDSACPGQCNPDCTCPYCGDGVVNQPSEECDGGDDGACPGQCDPDCNCPPPFCGNGVVDESLDEECDPPDDAACPGDCDTDTCICTYCGDHQVNRPSEECDGGDDSACPGQCNPDCTCPYCGDDVVNQPSEECDGGDDAACPGQCQPDCTCFPPLSWTCDPGYYGADDGCDCGCGALDPDCVDATVGSCQFCDDPGSCGTGPCPANIDLNENWHCSVCGDGVVNQASEACDPPEDSACPGQCNPDCTCPYCGDDVVNQPSEECDGADDTACPGQCNPDCTCAPYCGDGVVNQASEQCDPPEDSACPGQCNPDCTCPPYCGDGVVNQPSEECDSPDEGACPGQCNPDCTCAPYCGDGVVNQGSEECDGTDDTACPGQCNTDCTCPPPFCGDGVVNQPSEECDPPDDPNCPGNCRLDCSCVPLSWTCDLSFYGASDGCDCGCGALDPDCVDATVGSCQYCNDPGSCATDPCPADIDPNENWHCQ